jgi:uncharacterized protein YxjI
MQSSYAGKPCPKCAYVRASAETAPDWQCPSCGIAYLKYVEAQSSPQRQIGSRTSSGPAIAGLDLTAHPEVLITQKSEVVQLLPVETTAPYRILGTAGKPLGYAAATKVGSSFEFELHFFNLVGKTVFHGVNVAPLMGSSYFLIYDSQKLVIGAIRSKLSFLTSKFSIENNYGETIMEVESPIWGLSPLVFTIDGKKIALAIRKSEGGILSNFFNSQATRDVQSSHFKAFSQDKVEFHGNSLENEGRMLVLAAALYVPMIEHERRSRN